MRLSRVVAAAASLMVASLACADGVGWVADSVVPRAVEGFDLRDVRITGGPLKVAQDVDRAYLLRLDPDALLHGMHKTMGLPTKADHYGGWESGGGGGMIGHYLSACAMMYASTGDAEIGKRIDYVVGEFERLQKHTGGGLLVAFKGDVGYFDDLAKGKIRTPPVNGWYVTHKQMAGARDAWMYAGNKAARGVFLRFCDWAVDVTKNLSDEQCQTMMGGEHGAPHDVLADAYALTGDQKYLDAAKKFRHRKIFDPVLAGDVGAMDRTHANTQIAKFVGYQRLYDVTGEDHWHEASKRFYDAVVNDRTWVIGGNSQWEGFFPRKDFPKVIHEVCGPETCNTYNMLKLARRLYEREPDARYIEYYERALFNHILSSQDNVRGGFVYYSSMRPGHYRTFSTDFGGFWCCVGTGMENHGKYGELIYAKAGDELMVNLLVPSELDWADRKLKVRTETDFPAGDRATLTIVESAGDELAINVRHPAWVAAGAMTLRVNGEAIKVGKATPNGYVPVKRSWKAGDTLEITWPKRLTTEFLPGSDAYVAVLDGPIVLAGALGDADLGDGVSRPEGRTGNMLARKIVAESEVPMLVGKAGAITRSLRPVAGKPLVYTTGDLARPRPVEVMPFYAIGDQRYVVYWRLADAGTYASERDRIAREEKAMLALEARTVDHVRPGEQQPEADHRLQTKDSRTGRAPPPYGEWRDASGFFSYEMATGPGRLAVRCVYWGSDAGRAFQILVDGKPIARPTLDGDKPGEYVAAEYPIPTELTEGRDKVTVRFEALPGSNAGGVFDVRLVRQ